RGSPMSASTSPRRLRTAAISRPDPGGGPRVGGTARRDPAAPPVTTPVTLEAAAEQCQRCRACPLYQHATQAVFGEGRPGAAIALVGEQPGNDEDLTRRPL